MNAFWKRYPFLLFMIAGVVVIAAGMRYYASPETRLVLYGITLDNEIGLTGPVDELMGWHSQVDSWTEHDGRLDTPLANESSDEASTLRIERTKGTAAEDEVKVKPQEWIRSFKSADGFKNQTIPLNHPSIAAGTIFLDKEGTLLERQAPAAWRVARALPFIFPKFPKGMTRKASAWTEHIEWTDPVSEWKIGWQADLHWILKDFDDRYGKHCAVLVYSADLRPTVIQGASWAGLFGKDIHFEGQGNGEALYDIKDKFLIANTFTYDGTIKIHVPNLANVPDELRVGVALAPTEGDVLLKFKNKIDTRLP